LRGCDYSSPHKLNPRDRAKLLCVSLLAAILSFFDAIFQPLDQGNVLRDRSVRRTFHRPFELLDVRDRSVHLERAGA